MHRQHTLASVVDQEFLVGAYRADRATELMTEEGHEIVRGVRTLAASGPAHPPARPPPRHPRHDRFAEAGLRGVGAGIAPFEGDEGILRARAAGARHGGDITDRDDM